MYQNMLFSAILEDCPTTHSNNNNNNNNNNDRQYFQLK